MYMLDHKTQGWIHGNQTVASVTDATHRACILSAYRFSFSFQHSTALSCIHAQSAPPVWSFLHSYNWWAQAEIFKPSTP